MFLLATAKGNLGAAVAVHFRTVKTPAGVIVCEWGDPDSALTAEDIYKCAETKLETAMKALLAVTDQHPEYAKDLIQRIQHIDPLLSKTTIERARAVLKRQDKLRSQIVTQGGPRATVWYQPQHAFDGCL